MTGSVLVIVLVTKFTRGAWIVCIAMPLLYLLMRSDPQALRPRAGRARRRTTTRSVTLPARVHAIVLVSKMHKPTLRALAFARATRPSTLEALTVDVDDDDTARAAGRVGAARDPGAAQGARLALPRDHPADPRLRAQRCGGASPRDLVIVYVPEYVVGHWWEQLLHNQSALRLKAPPAVHPRRHGRARCRGSSLSERARRRPARARAPSGAVRRGEPDGRGRRTPSSPPSTTDADREPSVTDGAGPGARRARGGRGSPSRSARSRTAGTASPGTRASVVFVRHALPGERVEVVVTGCGAKGALPAGRRRRGARAPRRTACEPPCPLAGAGRLRRLRLAARRARRRSARSRPTVLREQLAPARRDRRDRRRAPAERSTSWRCPATSTGLRLAHPGAATPSTPTAAPGFHGHRSHEVERRRALPARHRRASTPSASRARPGPAPTSVAVVAIVRRRPRGASVEPSTVAHDRLAARASTVPRAARARLGRARSRRGREWRVAARRLLAGAPRCRRHPGRRRARGARRRSRASTCSTSTPVSGCSPGRWPPTSGRSGRVDAVEAVACGACADARRNLHDLPERPHPRRRASSRWLRSRRAPDAADLVVLDPPRSGAGAEVLDARARPRPRARSPTSPATRPRSAATSGSLRAAGWRVGLGAGLRPVPDDPARRVRRAACSPPA